MPIQRVPNVMERRRAREPSRLRVIFGPDAGSEIALPAVGVVVGADPACDVPLSLTRAVVPIGTTVRIGSSLLQLLPSEESLEIEPADSASFGAIWGSSLVMRRIYALLERASASNASMLLQGESGTGKELAARAIHERGLRCEGPFVVFDCGAASEPLIESELFGHKAGAFPSAHTDRVGAFARAHGGTLLLDEIGDLPQSLQPKHLRLLEHGEVTPLGANGSERYDVRCIAATNRDLQTEVARGTFRGDLYYRLGVIEISLPPLRSRIEDIPQLTRHFLRAAGAKDEVVEGPALKRLEAYGWPGNVRELRNVITRAVTFAPPGASFSRMPIILNPAAASAPNATPTAKADIPYHDAKAALLAGCLGHSSCRPDSPRHQAGERHPLCRDAERGRETRSPRPRYRAQALEPKLVRLVVRPDAAAAADSGLRVVRDGVTLERDTWGTPFPIDPGKHVVTATSPGKTTWSTAFEIDPASAGNTREVQIPALAIEAPPSTSSTQKTLGLIAGGVGIIALGVGTGFALDAKSTYDDAKSRCTPGSCDDASRTRAESAGNTADVATGFFIGGAVVLAVGVVLFVTAPRHATTTPSVGAARSVFSF